MVYGVEAETGDAPAGRLAERDRAGCSIRPSATPAASIRRPICACSTRGPPTSRRRDHAVRRARAGASRAATAGAARAAPGRETSTRRSAPANGTIELADLAAPGRAGGEPLNAAHNGLRRWSPGEPRRPPRLAHGGVEARRLRHRAGRARKRRGREPGRGRGPGGAGQRVAQDERIRIDQVAALRRAAAADPRARRNSAHGSHARRVRPIVSSCCRTSRSTHRRPTELPSALAASRRRRAATRWRRTPGSRATRACATACRAARLPAATAEVLGAGESAATSASRSCRSRLASDGWGCRRYAGKPLPAGQAVAGAAHGRMRWTRHSC